MAYSCQRWRDEGLAGRRRRGRWWGRPALDVEEAAGAVLVARRAGSAADGAQGRSCAGQGGAEAIRPRGRFPLTTSRSPRTEAESTRRPRERRRGHPPLAAIPNCSPSRPPEFQLQPLATGGNTRVQLLAGRISPLLAEIPEPHARTQFEEGLSSQHPTTRK